MRFWVMHKGNCVFTYSDKDERESCEKCLGDSFVGQCIKKRQAVRKLVNDDAFVFCFEGGVPAKQARFLAKLATDGYKKIGAITTGSQESLASLEGIVLHNIRKLTAGIGQKIDAIVSEEDAAEAHNKIELFKSRVLANPNAVARELLSIRKSVNQIEFEYNALEWHKTRRVGDESWFTSHKAHTVVVMSYYMYEAEFRESKLWLNIAAFYGDIFVDFSAARSAISQVLMNAIKYCKPESAIGVEFFDGGETVGIVFKMVSRFFTNEEAQKFTMLLYRGVNSSGTDGEGIGLYTAELMMKLNNGGFAMRSNEGTKFRSDGVYYSNNEVELLFRKAPSH